MKIFSDIYNRIVDEEFIQALEDDNIDVKSDVISRAKYGDAEAIHTIGCMYASKKKNKEKAILCLGTSSAMGFYQSQTRLGDVFAKDNYAAASNWYRRAQNNGVKDAYLRMGELLFSKGNFTEAEVEFKKAAGFGDPCSQNRLGEYYKEIKCRPNVGTIQPIYSLAMQWFRKAADQNYSKAQYNIGRLYECGGGDVFSDYYQSIEWYQKYKDGGFEDADTAIERLNKQGYFYIPQKSSSSSNTIVESEVCEMENLIKLSKVKKELQSLKSSHPERKIVIENLDDLMAKLATK